MNTSKRTEKYLSYLVNKMSQREYDAHLEAAKETARASIARGASTEEAHRLFVSTLSFRIAMH